MTFLNKHIRQNLASHHVKQVHNQLKIISYPTKKKLDNMLGEQNWWNIIGRSVVRYICVLILIITDIWRQHDLKIEWLDLRMYEGSTRDHLLLFSVFRLFWTISRQKPGPQNNKNIGHWSAKEQLLSETGTTSVHGTIKTGYCLRCWFGVEWCRDHCFFRL